MSIYRYPYGNNDPDAGKTEDDAESDGLSGVQLPKIAGTEITAVMIAGVILIAACVIAAVILIAGLIRNNRDQLEGLR